MITINEKQRGVKQVTRSSLYGVPVPTSLPQWEKNAPEYTYWNPINHGKLADCVVNNAKNYGDIVNETWSLCMDGMGLVGAIEFAPDNTALESLGVRGVGNFKPQGLSSFLLVRHSNNAKWALRFIIGMKVLVCSNGMVVDRFIDDPISKKHSKHTPYYVQVESGVKASMLSFNKIQRTKNDLEGIELTQQEGDHLLVQAYHKNVMPWSNIAIAAQEWKSPQFRDFSPRNGWSLYNAMTFAAKGRSPSDQIDSIQKSSEVIFSYDNIRELESLR